MPSSIQSDHYTVETYIKDRLGRHLANLKKSAGCAVARLNAEVPRTWVHGYLGEHGVRRSYGWLMNFENGVLCHCDDLMLRKIKKSYAQAIKDWNKEFRGWRRRPSKAERRRMKRAA